MYSQIISSEEKIKITSSDFNNIFLEQRTWLMGHRETIASLIFMIFDPNIANSFLFHIPRQFGPIIVSGDLRGST